MITASYQEALEAFGNSFHDFLIEPLKGGLINQSYKVSSKLSGDSFLLQQVNTNVFTDPVAVQSNYEKIWDHLSEAGKSFLLPEPKYFPENTLLFCDSQGHYWRAFEFIMDGQCLSVPENILQVRSVANSFANFTSSLSDFDITELAVTIPGFHDLSLKYRQFDQSIHHHRFERLQKASAVINELRKRDRYVNLYEVFIESGEFPQRVMHHDAKISNILFSKTTGKVICPVDLDTTMPGYFFSDIGDIIRTMAVSADENSTNTESIHIQPNFYQAIITGYFDLMENELTASEKKYIHYSGLLMTFMQALRFITDYLNGDIYYRTTYPEQNFDRAKNQLAVLQKLEEFLKAHHGFNP